MRASPKVHGHFKRHNVNTFSGGSQGVGIILAPNRKVALSGGGTKINGAVIAGGDIAFSGGAQVVKP